MVNEFADRLKSEYELYLFALTGRYLSTMAPGIEVTPSVVSDFKRAAAPLRLSFLATAKQTIDEYTSKNPSETAQTRAATLEADLARISLENVSTLVLAMKGSQQVMFASIKDAGGAMGLALQKKLSNPDFKVTSMGGRKYAALGYLYTQARHFAYLTQIEARLAQMAADSDLAQVAYSDPAHAGNGTQFSISGTTKGYPSYASLIDTVFHYNSSAMVASHV